MSPGNYVHRAEQGRGSGLTPGPHRVRLGVDNAPERRVGARLSACLHAAVGDHADVVHAEHLGQVLNQFADRGQLLLDVLQRLMWREVARSARQRDVVQTPVNASSPT